MSVCVSHFLSMFNKFVIRTRCGSKNKRDIDSYGYIPFGNRKSCGPSYTGIGMIGVLLLWQCFCGGSYGYIPFSNRKSCGPSYTGIGIIGVLLLWRCFCGGSYGYIPFGNRKSCGPSYTGIGIISVLLLWQCFCGGSVSWKMCLQQECNVCR